MKKTLLIFTFLFFVTYQKILAQGIVTTEHIKSGWQFTKIMRPSQSDAARDVAIKVIGNKPIASCLSVDGLNNGVLPQECRLLRDFFCFTNDNANGGKIVMDLGKVTPISMINSYSAHGPVGGTTWCEEFDGSRAPQVYTLYASAVENPDTSNLNSKDWVEIAKVDTRPTASEDSWVGQYGVNIEGKDGGLLGNFRWIVWEVKSTLKPKCVNPNWTDTWYTELDVHTPETVKKGGDAIMSGTQLEEIILVFKSHFDIGFTHPAPDIVNVYRTDMIDKALKIIDESKDLPAEKRFSWTIPSWVAHQILWAGQDPARKTRVIEAIKTGRIVVHGLPITYHTESLELEDLVFGLSLNKNLSEELGIPMSRSGKLTDVPSHSWILPTLMKNAGMDFLHIGVNPCNERPDVPLLYYWQGPDGSKLLTMHPQGYGSDVEFGHGLFPPKNWPYKHWLAMIVATDNAAPPTIKDLEALIKQAEITMPGVKVRMGKMEDFADAIFDEEKAGAVVPVINSDMPDCWIHGVGTMPIKEALARKTRADIMAVKILDTHLRSWGIKRNSITDSLNIAQERSMMFGEHTWGGNRNLEGKKAYSQEDFGEFIETDKSSQYLMKTWKDHSDYIDSAANIVNSIAANELQQLVQAVSVKGDRIVVYNTLPWQRDAIVEIPNSNNQKFEAKNLPACGYKTYSLKDIKYKEEAFIETDSEIVENKFFKIKLDKKRGGIISIVNKKDGRELVDPNGKYAFGQYFFERFDSVQLLNYHLGCNHLNTVYQANGRACKGWNIRADLPSKPEYQCAVADYETMEVRNTTTATEIILKASPKGIIKSKVTTLITIPHNYGWIDIKVQLDDKKPDYWPEAGSIYIPINATEPQFRIGRLGAVVDPAKDFVEGCNRTYGYSNMGAMIGDNNGKGVAITPLNHGLMSFGDKGICTIDTDYIPTKPLAIVNIFNTIWTINFPYWVKDSLSSTVRVWATDDMEAKSLIDGALEARNVVMTARGLGNGGILAKSAEGLKTSRRGIEVTAMETYSDGTLLRMWECFGNSDNITITLPQGKRYTKATPVNLRGEAIGEAININNYQFTFDINAYSPMTFMLK